MNTPNTPIRDNKVLSWATDLDAKTMAQAHRTAGLSFVHEPLALMADAHLGMGATVGSVVATEGSIIPAAVGVDIGCGMIAQKTVFTREQVDPFLTKTRSTAASPRRCRRVSLVEATGVTARMIVRSVPRSSTDSCAPHPRSSRIDSTPRRSRPSSARSAEVTTSSS